MRPSLNPVPDIIADGLLILFVGYNPGLRSAAVGHHFAGGSNRFWKLLHDSGCAGLRRPLPERAMPDLVRGAVGVACEIKGASIRRKAHSYIELIVDNEEGLYMSIEPPGISQTTGKPEMSFLDRIAGLFYEPAMVFRSLCRRPDYVLPAILILLASAMSFVAALRLDLSSILTPDRLEAAAKVPRITMAVSSAVSVVVMMSLGWVLRSLVFVGLGKAMGGEGRFAPSFSAQGYVMIAQFIGILLSTVVLLNVGRPVPLALSYFLPAAKLRTPLGVLTGEINPFVLGYLILAPIAVAETAGISRRKALGIVMPVWILVVLIQVGMAAVGAALQGG